MLFFSSTLIISKLHAKLYIVDNKRIVEQAASQKCFFGTNIVNFHQKLSTLVRKFSENLTQEEAVLERIGGIDEELVLTGDVGCSGDLWDHSLIGAECCCPDYFAGKACS